MAHDLFLGNQTVLPRGLTVLATVTHSHRRRPITALDRPELHLRLNELILPDGSRVPLSAKFLRAGPFELKQREAGEAELKGQGAGKWGVASVGGSATRGAVSAGPIGAAVGAASGMIAQSVIRPRDLALPRGITFEIELTRDLEIPAQTNGLAEWYPSRAARVLTLSPAAPDPEPAAASMPAPPDSRSSTNAPPPAARPAPEGRSSAPSPVVSTPAFSPSAELTFKVNVDLVTVEGVIRDSKGRFIDNLRVEDFRVLDDGEEQRITHFSRDQLPLAIALVVDRSGSVARHPGDLRRAALETLSQLKAQDKVAVFCFADSVVRMTDLIGDRQSAAELIPAM